MENPRILMLSTFRLLLFLFVDIVVVVVIFCPVERVPDEYRAYTMIQSLTDEKRFIHKMFALYIQWYRQSFQYTFIEFPFAIETWVSSSSSSTLLIYL